MSFELLKEKASTVVESHGWDWNAPVQVYTDASKYAGGCLIVQLRPLATALAKSPTITPPPTKHPIVLDSFSFNKTEYNYSTFKRELYIIISFVRKYFYMF